MLSANTSPDQVANSGPAVEHAEDTKPSAPHQLLPSTRYSCSSCQVVLQNGQEQRIHMKEPWHVNNIQRRIADLSPMSCDDFHAQAEKNQGERRSNKQSSATSGTRHRKEQVYSDEGDKQDNEQDEAPASPFQCLFCNQDFGADGEGFTANLSHMYAAHGFAIPDADRVLDMQSFVGYLATEVRAWHECLYCGASKESMSGIQSHMRDRGHCRVNLEREPELLGFWDSPEDDEDANADGGGDGDALTVQDATALSATEIRFASGRVIASRHAAPATSKRTRSQGTSDAATGGDLVPLSGSAEAAPSQASHSGADETPPRLSSGRQLARREEMGILGVSPQQRQALVMAEKKAQRSEAVARRAREWVSARGANAQKFDQIDNQGKWGKQNHKLLPR